MAKDRIDSLAKIIKTTGKAYGRSMDQIRADLFVAADPPQNLTSDPDAATTTG